MVKFDKLKAIAEAKEVLEQSQRVLEIALALESARPHQIALFEDFRLRHGRLPTRNDFASQLVAMIQNDLDIELQGKMCIDIGCRSGENALAMQQAGAKVIGIDPDDSEFQVAIQGGMEKECLHKITLQEFLAQFPDKKFDLATVFLWNILAEEQDSFAAALKEVIHVQGTVVIGYADVVYDQYAQLSVFKLMSSVFTKVDRFEFPHRTNQYILKCTKVLDKNTRKISGKFKISDPISSVLQIGGAERILEHCIYQAWGRPIESLGMFDQIYLFPPVQKPLQTSGFRLFEKWSSIFSAIVYSDQDIDCFLEKLAPNDRVHALSFFYELEKKKNITSKQLLRIAEYFRSQFGIGMSEAYVDVFSVIKACLQRHWKKETELKCYMQDGYSLYEDPNVFNEIIVNPNLIYKEIQDLGSQAMWITIRKVYRF